MIYLIMKIFLYLVLALAAGGGAGWLLRNIAATKREDELNRALSEARARVPQFEAQLRAREDQGKRSRDDMTTKERVIAELMDEVKSKEEALREKERELKKLSVRNLDRQASDITSSETVESPDDVYTSGEVMAADTLDYAASVSTDLPAVDAELRNRISELEAELSEARTSAADAIMEASAAETEVLALKAELANRGLATPGDSGSKPLTEELEARLRQKAEDYDRLNRNYETEKRKVLELERERELQNKSLQVLHQQLELERERGHRSATG